jgi:putative endonuclease
MRSYYVYIMGNRSGTLYIGVTNDLERRLLEHRSGTGRFTGRYRLVKLLYYEVTGHVYGAICREKQLKGWLREKKVSLIRTQNPAMKDLAPELFGWRAGQFSVTRRSVGSRRVTKTDPSFRQDDKRVQG